MSDRWTRVVGSAITPLHSSAPAVRRSGADLAWLAFAVVVVLVEVLR